MTSTEIIKQAQIDNIQRLVVGAIIVKEDRVLFLKRPNNDFMGGIYELPSGKVENQEGLIDALIREVKEETNLNVSAIIEFIGSFDYISKSGKHTRQFNYLIEVEDGIIRLTEHTDHQWILPINIKKYNITNSVQNIITTYLEKI